MRSALTTCFAVLATAALVSASSAGCTGRPQFQCAANDVCVSETGSPGICELSGSCSFPDNTCAEAGRRYPDGAGSLASACVAAPASSKCVAAIGLGTNHSCLVKTDGSVWCWGANDVGQLGDGTTVAKAVPTRVNMPAGTKATSVSAGEQHSCALDSNGGVWCWGANGTRQLGVGTADSLVPVSVPIVAGLPPQPVKVTAMTVGGKHTCAIADKVVYCWGENSDGQCGQDATKADDVDPATAVDGLEGVIAVGAGDEFTCALRDDKTVWCWGANANGELGNGSSDPSFKPVKVTLTSVGQLASGDEHACGVKDDGSVWCWGYGQSGALGTGRQDDAHTPVAVATAKSVVASGESFHTCSINGDGALQCWGANDATQLGAGRLEPNVLTPAVVQLVTVKTVALGGKHTCATTFDGALWCWGANDLGQLGLGSTGTPQALPQRVPFSCGP